MLRSKIIALCVVLLQCGPAVAEPPSFAHLLSPRLACLGTLQAPTECIQLSPGYFFDEPTYNKLDTEMKRLQDAETRLQAENESFRKFAATWQPGWLTIGTALVAGVALGVYVDRKI